jgi:protein tyrosine phosphatase (PTP) superfamily phosphohydrolase (DUF442 family)
LLLVLVSGFSAIASAQTSPGGFTGIKIENFGQMDENYFRGAQPKPDDYKALKELGITTVIDLQGSPTDYEKSAVEALGMKYVNIPMSGFRYPKEELIEEYLKLVNNPETGKVFVHCKAGVHRTGVAGAVYRMTKYGWDYDKAYQEMKNYEFYTGFFHGAFKSYVKDYAKRMVAQKAKAAAETVAVQSK